MHSDLKISSLFDSVVEAEDVYSSDSDCEYTFTIEVMRSEKTKRQFYKTLAEQKDTLNFIEIQEEVPVRKKPRLDQNTTVTVGLANEVIIETVVDEAEFEDEHIVIEEVNEGDYTTDYDQEGVTAVEPGEIIMPISQNRIKRDQELREKLHELRKKIPDPFVYCDQCFKRFTSDKLMGLHKKLYHLPPDGYLDLDLSSMKEFLCPLCEKYKTSNRFNFKMHLKMTHNYAVTEEPLGASNRTKPRLSLSAIRRGDVTVRQNFTSEYYCEQCSRQFSALKQLEAHLLQHENARRYICDICGASFNVAEYLRIHRNLHVDIKCGICLEEFVFRKDYITHHSFTHAGLQKICIIDGELANPNNVPGRTKVPKTSEEFNCTDCGKSFFSRKGYQKHKCKGTDNYPCRIGNCSFVADTLEELKQHRHREMMITQRETQRPKIEFSEATCSSCNRSYKSKKGFESHKCKGDRIVTCPFPSCGMECYTISDYYDHVESVHKQEVNKKRVDSPDLNHCIEEEEVLA